MKTVKVKTTNAFTYREGYGSLPVVDAAPGAVLPNYKPLYYASRKLGSNEELEVYTDGTFLTYKEPVRAPAPKSRPTYISRTRKR